MFMILLLCLLFCVGSCKETKQSVEINLFKPVTFVDENYLSVATGASVLKRHLKSLNITSNKVITLAKALSTNSRKPNVYVRINANCGTFDNVQKENELLPPRFTINATEFNEIISFCTKVGWKVIFTLNALLRSSDGSWNPDNAVKFIDYVTKEGYYIDYELGNEPDLYPKYKFINIPPQQLAEDFKKLKHILDKKTRDQSRLYGPDMASLTRYDYFSKFLSHLEENILDGVTYHHYYSSSDNITVKNFTSVQYLDSFLLYMQKAKSIINSSLTNADRVPVWLGETSSTYGGGSSVGMSFAAGFLWLDKLGLAAQMNISVVIRQTFKSGKYSLLDRHYRPAPDYWISVLYKRLVGRTVLNVTGFLQLNRSIRVYAHCINPFGKVGYKKYEIVLLILNLNKTDNGVIEFTQDSLKNLEVDQYLFSPSNGNLDDFYVNLNGQTLKMINDTTLPELNPVKIRQLIVIPPLQYGFYVLDGSYAKACMYS